MCEIGVAGMRCYAWLALPRRFGDPVAQHFIATHALGIVYDLSLLRQYPGHEVGAQAHDGVPEELDAPCGTDVPSDSAVRGLKRPRTRTPRDAGCPTEGTEWVLGGQPLPLPSSEMYGVHSLPNLFILSRMAAFFMSANVSARELLKG